MSEKNILVALLLSVLTLPSQAYVSNVNTNTCELDFYGVKWSEPQGAKVKVCTPEYLHMEYNYGEVRVYVDGYGAPIEWFYKSGRHSDFNEYWLRGAKSIEKL